MRTLHNKTSELCKILFSLERQGRYEEALSEIGDLWLDKNHLPNIEGLSPVLAAEFVLRCGSLFGFLGHNKQISDSQEKSRNLLTYARNIFTEHYNVEKIAECENYLALTYWRTGELNEAETWLEETLAHNLPDENYTRIYSYVIKALVLIALHKPLEIIEKLSHIEKAVLKSEDNCLKGSYYNQIGVAWDILGNIPNALTALEKSKKYYAAGEHRIYLGVVCNDLSLLYKTARNFEKAHQMIDLSTSIFKKNQDRTREGFSLDTKSQIFLSENKTEEALETIEKAVAILCVSENAAYLVETLSTKIKILISMDKISAATLCLIEAVELAKSKISEKAANNVVEIYETYLREHFLFPPVTDDSAIGKQSDKQPNKELLLENIELLLPSPLSNFDEIQGVWINNSHLENAGISKDSLAVVVPTEEIKRGDLIAIEEIENSSVSCGFYDNEFGIICLEGSSGEPLLFDEEKINIVGKIVGVAREQTNDGKMIVEPI